MTVRHFVHVLPTFAAGGVQIRLSYLMNHLDLPVRHTVIAMDGNFSASSRIGPDVEIGYREPPKGRTLAGRLMSYRRTLKDLKPDLLLTYQWGAIEWALANRVGQIAPQMHLESGFGAAEAVTQLRRRVWMRRLALGHIKLLIVPSLTLQEIARRDWHVDPAKIRYIPNGVDCEKYAALPVAGGIPGFEKQPGEKIIGTLTPLRPEKNLARLIRAFADISGDIGPARLLILGEGGERAKLQALVAELGLGGRVLLPGHVDAPEKALGWFDLYAISSDTEQMPNAVNQAMAAGKAVVGLAVGDVRHIVSDANKPFIAAKGDDAGFRDAMRRLLQDDDLRLSLGQANADHVRKTYALEGMLRAYHEVWA
ncbi:glycosyltransferase family 4 protein [Govanella unica]|uniref:Glycosyltransferase family 4 protein n=1 Tax=Govanella unica TaxID=2975056 RepID=A0A9X3TY90_9PROT|nr:glycosyltransferase family 4 protein [Govania unica]MDA5193582.1 glycosyltransferase family 4 protein [Govania unica]